MLLKSVGRPAKKPNCEEEESWKAVCWSTARASEVDSYPRRTVHLGTVRKRTIVQMPQGAMTFLLPF